MPMYGAISRTPPPLKLLPGVAGDGGRVAMPIVGVWGEVILDEDVW